MNSDRPTILITGGTGQIGRVLVRHFLSRGWRVIATGRSKTSLQALADFCGDAGENLDGVEIDLETADAVERLGSSLDEHRANPDVLVNNARNLHNLHVGASGVVSKAKFIGEFVLDVVVPYQLTMSLTSMDGSRLKSVINIGSQYGSVVPNPMLYDDFAREAPIHYGVAKAALAHLTKELAVRLAPQSIRVNCIAFGGVEGRASPELSDRISRLSPSGRMLRQEEVTEPVEFLATSSSSGMTGHIMAVDGGWTLW